MMRKIAGCACAGNIGNVFPIADFKGNRLWAIPVCITRHARAMMDVKIAHPRWRGKSSQYSRGMRNPQFYVSGKRPILLNSCGYIYPFPPEMLHWHWIDPVQVKKSWRISLEYHSITKPNKCEWCVQYMSCSDTPSQVAKTLGLTAIKHRSGISATVIVVQIGGKLLSAMQGRGSIFAAPTLKLLIAICPMSKFQEFKFIYMYQKTCGNMNVKIQSWPYDLMNDMETNTHWLSSSINHRLLQGNICISRCLETIISWDYQMIQKWTKRLLGHDQNINVYYTTHIVKMCQIHQRHIHQVIHDFTEWF